MRENSREIRAYIADGENTRKIYCRWENHREV